MAKQHKALQNPILAKAVKSLEDYEKRKKTRIEENNQRIENLKKKKGELEADMLKAANTGDSPGYVAAKKEHDEIVEQLNFMQSFVANGKKSTGCTKEEADAFFAETRAGFKKICEDLDQYLIKELEAMREKLAETEQVGNLLSDACEKFHKELDPDERRGFILFSGGYDYSTSDIGAILSDAVYNDPEYIELSGVKMRGTTFDGRPVFSDEKIREAEEISKELFNLR